MRVDGDVVVTAALVFDIDDPAWYQRSEMCKLSSGVEEWRDEESEHVLEKYIQ